MAEPHNLPDTIIENTGALFREKGYAATSIKEIAQASGCTTAALYYYFEDGKQQILREVIRRSAAGAERTLELPRADNLESSLALLTAHLAERLPRIADSVYWVLLQFATLPGEEKRILQDQALDIQRMLQEQIGRHVAEDETAGRLAWLVYCSFFGYQLMFSKMEVGSRVEFGLEEFGRFLARVIGRGIPPDTQGQEEAARGSA